MEWLRVPLKKIANVVSGFGFPQEYQGIKIGQYPFFKVSDMNAQGNEVFMSDAVNMISEQALNELKATIFPAGTVIFPKIGAAIATGKKRILVKPSTFDNNIMGLVPKSNVDYRFLYYWSLTFDFQSIANIGPVPSLRKSTIEQIDIPLPPISEQRRIVEILERADDLRKKRSQADRISDRILPALFIKMFGDPATNPKGWEMVKLESLGTLERGKSKHRPRNAPELYGGIYPFIQTGDIANCKWYIREYYQTYSDLGLKQSKMWKKGTLCITIAANIAKTGILSFDACFPDSVVGFRANNKTTTEFIKQWFDFIQKYLESLAPQSAQRNLNLETLRDLEIYLPPWDLQNQFTLALQRYQDIYSYIQKCDFKIDNLFQTLLHQAFSGELTAKWREAHMEELLQEMEHQAKALNLSDSEIEQLTLNL